MNDTSTHLTTETVLRRRPSPLVEWVEVDGEIVAWDQEGEALHLLDPIASLIFQLCDGTASLAVTVNDLAEAFGREPASLTDDVLAGAAALEEKKLVEPVR